jgi:ribonuclease R
MGRRYQLPGLPVPGEAHVKLARRLAAQARLKEKSSAVVQKPSAEQQAWEAAGLHCSANERRADEASRDVEAWLKCQYMREHLGEDFSGTVSGVTAFGVFVTLDAMYVEGLVHITELGGDYFKFDETRQELRGERTGISYCVGARVRVQVSRVDLDGRKIDFRWVQEEGAASVDKPLRGNSSNPGKLGRTKSRSSKSAAHTAAKSAPQGPKAAAKKNAATMKQKTKNRR